MLYICPRGVGFTLTSNGPWRHGTLAHAWPLRVLRNRAYMWPDALLGALYALFLRVHFRARKKLDSPFLSKWKFDPDTQRFQIDNWKSDRSDTKSKLDERDTLWWYNGGFCLSIVCGVPWAWAPGATRRAVVPKPEENPRRGGCCVRAHSAPNWVTGVSWRPSYRPTPAPAPDHPPSPLAYVETETACG